MFRRLVRFYFRLRYFPRLLIEKLNGISDALASLHRYEAEQINRLIAAHEERLARIHEEFLAFCDDAIRAMMAASAGIAKVDTRIAAVQHGMQRLDNVIVEAQSRLAVLQQSLHRPDAQADPQALAVLAELVRDQAMRIDRIETLLRRQAGGPSRSGELADPAHVPATPDGPRQTAEDDARPSRM